MGLPLPSSSDEWDEASDPIELSESSDSESSDKTASWNIVEFWEWDYEW